MNNKINIKIYLVYKFINTFFTGLSVGIIFTIYSPTNLYAIPQYIYSAGGILLGVGLMVVAFFYEKLLTIKFYFIISLFIELVILFIILLFLVYSYSLQMAIIVYIGYQVTFTFGSYLSRTETILIKNAKKLSLIDISKQSGYFIGMIISFLYYKSVDNIYNISNNLDQIYILHFILLLVQLFVIIFLIYSFRSKNENSSN